MNKKQINIFTIFLVICMVLTSISTMLTIGITNSTVDEDTTLKYHYTFSSPTINEMNGKEDTHQIQIDGLSMTNEYLQPRIPVKPISLLIPHGTIFESITVETSDENKIYTDINLEKGGAVIPLSQQSTKLKTENFQSTSYEPYENKQIYSVVGTYTFRGYRILHVNLYPIQYEEQDGQVSFYSSIDLNIQLKQSNPAGGLRNNHDDHNAVSQIIDNPEILNSYKTEESTIIILNEGYEYVIITNNEMKQAQGEYIFQDLINYKESKGVSATVVTVEEIENNPDFSVDGMWGDNNPDNPFFTSLIQGDKNIFDDTQAKIRNFIRYAYMTWETKYILLAGDSDTNNKKDIIVPHRGLFADEQGLPLTGTLEYETDDIPSDVYYACLDGNFNYDEDSHFGDAPKFNLRDANLDEADLYAEVAVGRACVDSEKEVSNFVKKSISYDELFYDDYFKRVLFLGEHLGAAFYFDWGGRYKDLIEPIFPSEYNITKLYQEDNSWDLDVYWYLLNEHPPLIINHDGHGSPTSAMRLNCPTIEDLSNDKYYFIYSHTCLAGSFDNCWPPDTYYDDDCVAEYFTVETEHGAIAVIMNSRYGLGSEYSPESPSGLYDESFFKGVFEKDIRQFGPANHYSKEDHIWHVNENGMRWAFYETNLLGDPELAFKDPSPQVSVSVEITNPIDEGCLYLNDGEPIQLSFLKMPYIINGISVKVNAETDPIGLVEYVEFRINNETVHVDDEYPYEYFWNNANIGAYAIQTIAYSSYDSSGSDEISAFYLW